MKKNALLFLALLFLFGCAAQKETFTGYSQKEIKSHFEWTIKELNNPTSKSVLVAAHRGDWRNAPENSIQSLKSAIAMGVDIVELDLKKTREGQLVVMHDKTIDRSTTGKGKPEDYTYEELKKFKLRNGMGRASNHTIPLFSDFLVESKGKVILNVDKGYDYFNEVVALLRQHQMLDQAVINIDDNTSLDSLESRFGKLPVDVMVMPIIVYKDTAKASAVLNSYRRHQKTFFQPVFAKDESVKNIDFMALREQGFSIWINSLWASLNGGHDDDKAVEENKAEESWGWLVSKGANIIQTDRPAPLLKYLKAKKLHK